MKNLAKIRAKAKELYKSFGKVFCPYLQAYVNFNAKGFNHIRYSRSREERNFNEQFLRYQNISFARLILKKSNTVQEIDESEVITKRINSVTYLGFIAIIKKKKFKVVVRKDNQGGYYFYSLIPKYITRQKSDKKLK